MDYVRVLLVPVRPTSLMLVATFSVVMTFFLRTATSAGAFGIAALLVVFMLNTWVLKYCFVLVEQLADGATEPPVMDADMVSPFETRPLTQAIVIAAGATLCWKIGGTAGLVVAAGLLLALPAQIALISMGENVFRAMNPLAWLRVIRGLGPMYVLLLAVLALAVIVSVFIGRITQSTFLKVAVLLLTEVGFFGLIGSAIWLRRRQLGYEPSRSPERTAERAEAERIKARARMMDEVFEQARIGKHVDATAPLARWLRDLDAEYAVRDAMHVAEQALKWQLPLALNPIGSTLIRHLLRFGRPDAALSVYALFRQQSPRFTMDSAPDLRTLADYADSVGKTELASSMRLETPVHHPAV